MEIGPIQAIRIVLPGKLRENDPRFAGFLEVENAAAASEDSFLHDEGNAAGGQDRESEMDEQAESKDEDVDAGGSGSTVNIFA